MTKSVLLLLFLFTEILFSFSARGQGLTGKWQWENEEMRAEVYFSDDRYYMEAFILNTQSQLSEGFSYFMIEGDTLIFNRVPISKGREPIAYHLIAYITDYDMELIDLASGEKDRYTRINRDYVQLEQYRKNEFYYAGGTIVCISDVAEKNYVDVNIFEDENKDKLAQLATLPTSCYESGLELERQKDIYLKYGVFTEGMIDWFVKYLKDFKDQNLRAELKDDGDKIMELVNKYFHCG